MLATYLNEKLSDKELEFLDMENQTIQGMIHQFNSHIISGLNELGMPFWAKRDAQAVKRFSYLLVKKNICKSEVRLKYSKLTIDPAIFGSQLIKERVMAKMSNFCLKLDTTHKENNRVKINGKVSENGIIRSGFALAAKREFSYDVDYINKYRSLIFDNINKTIVKGIEKGKIKDKFLNDKANYSEVINHVLDYYLLDGARKYNNEGNISDSRGRSIYESGKRIGNFITYKDFRSMIRIPNPILVTRDSVDELNDIYYFVAELTGSKGTTEEAKIEDGERAYQDRVLPKLCAKELHKYIWLERIYSSLDKVYKLGFCKWDIPVEVDASMSVAQVVGALTNDERLLERTNVVGSEITDPWSFEGVRRTSAKAAGTPVFYGSSASTVALLKSKDVDIRREEVTAINKEFSKGGLAVIKQFKDCMIKGYKDHRPQIEMKVWDDTYTLTVNKWKQSGSKIVVCEVYTKDKGFRKSFTHEPIMIPDYDYMKLYFATCLVHGLDSNIADKVIIRHKNSWVVSIHDAFICLPGVARRVRLSYADILQEVNKNRDEIIKNYRLSIGATTMKDNINFMKLNQMIHQLEEGTKFLPTAMK